MRKPMAALVLLVVALVLGEGCAPVPLPHYAAYPAKRVEELLVDSENLRQAGDEWERFWFLDQPSHMTPFGPTAASVPDPIAIRRASPHADLPLVSPDGRSRLLASSRPFACAPIASVRRARARDSEWSPA